MADNQSIIGTDVIFKGKITNSKTIEINGRVEADIKSEKITLGKTASFEGGIQADLVVISGKYQGKLKADSVWLTDSSIITGEALNCRVVHNWDEKKMRNKKNDEESAEEDLNENN